VPSSIIDQISNLVDTRTSEMARRSFHVNEKHQHYHICRLLTLFFSCRFPPSMSINLSDFIFNENNSFVIPIVESRQKEKRKQKTRRGVVDVAVGVEIMNSRNIISTPIQINKTTRKIAGAWLYLLY
jgi:hypothetical protein